MTDRPVIPRRVPMRQLRREAKRQRKVQQWWTAVPPAERQPFYRCKDIGAAIGLAPQAVAAALRGMGWRHSRARITGPPIEIWIPPDNLAGAASPADQTETIMKGFPI